MNALATARAEKIWGGILPVPPAPESGRALQCVQAGQEDLGRLLAHWAALPASDRPRLNGLSAKKTEGSGHSLQLLLDQGEGLPELILRIYQSGSFPRPSKLWPYSAWWEEELRIFEGVLFADVLPERGAVWQPH
jgi:hypothetical protein